MTVVPQCITVRVHGDRAGWYDAPVPQRKQAWEDAVGDARWAEEIPPAPGNLRFVQAFINSADLGSAPDELADPTALAGYLARWNLLPASVDLSAADLAWTLAVREDLRALLRSNVGKTLDPAVAVRLERAASSAFLQVRFVGGARLVPATADLDGVLGGFLKVFAEARLAGRWSRFKACAGDDCGLCFCDASNNLTRRYCTVRCSNRNKSRTFRRRNPGYRYLGR